jgi:hypothetical protein
MNFISGLEAVLRGLISTTVAETVATSGTIFGATVRALRLAASSRSKCSFQMRILFVFCFFGAIAHQITTALQPNTSNVLPLKARRSRP